MLFFLSNDTFLILFLKIHLFSLLMKNNYFHKNINFILKLFKLELNNTKIRINIII
jgi:hypothetical protein